MVFTLSSILFSLWILYIFNNWTLIQSLRNSDPLWLVKGVSPWINIVIIGYVLLFFTIVRFDLDGKALHLIFISYLVMVIDWTPYFLSTSCRFPDTFGVVKSSTLLPEVLSNSIMLPYPRSFPISYMLFYITRSISSIDYFSFSRLIFVPLILVGIFIFWYMFTARFFDPKVAFISVVIAIPSQIIEVSITPNSLGTILVLISLFLCTSKKWNFRFVFIIIILALVLCHAIHPFILLIFLLFFYLYIRLLKSKDIDIDKSKIYSLFFVWLAWIFSESCFMGTGIVKTIHNILMMETKNLDQASTFTTGSGNLIAAFSWIQSLTMYKYMLYGLIVIVLIILDLYYMNVNTLSTFKKPNFTKKYWFLILALTLLSSTLCVLTFGGSDTQNLISRTLNYSMLCISVYIGHSFNSFKTQLKSTSSAVKVVLVVFILLTFITYPLYSYGKDSYINFPTSQEIGFNFFENHVFENNSDTNKNFNINPDSRSEYFYQFMHGTGSEILSIKRSVIYNNGWYSLSFF